MTKKKYKIVDKRGPKAFTIFGNANAGDYIEQNITVNKTDDFVSHMVYSLTNSLAIHSFLKGKNISKDIKECFEHKIENKKGKERLPESFLEECLEAAISDVEHGKWPIKTKLNYGLLGSSNNALD